MKYLIYEIGLSLVEAVILPSKWIGTASSFLFGIKQTKARKADRILSVNQVAIAKLKSRVQWHS